MISDEQEGPFQLKVSRIQAYRDSDDPGEETVG
jgi:hypothetical protein